MNLVPCRRVREGLLGWRLSCVLPTLLLSPQVRCWRYPWKADHTWFACTENVEAAPGSWGLEGPHPPKGVYSPLCCHFSERAICQATAQLPNSASLRGPGRPCLSPTNWLSGEVSGFGHWTAGFEELLLPLSKQQMPPLGLFLSPARSGEQPFPPPSSLVCTRTLGQAPQGLHGL